MDVTLPNGVVINGVPEGTTKAQIQEMAIRNGMASMEDFGGASAPLDKPFYETMPNEPKEEAPSEAFTKPSLDLSGQDVEKQSGVNYYVEDSRGRTDGTQQDTAAYEQRYKEDGSINHDSDYWKEFGSAKGVVDQLAHDKENGTTHPSSYVNVGDDSVGGESEGVQSQEVSNEAAKEVAINQITNIYEKMLKSDEWKGKEPEEVWEAAKLKYAEDAGETAFMALTLPAGAGKGLWQGMKLGSGLLAGEELVGELARAGAGEEVDVAKSGWEVGKGAATGALLGGAGHYAGEGIGWFAKKWDDINGTTALNKLSEMGKSTKNFENTKGKGSPDPSDHIVGDGVSAEDILTAKEDVANLLKMNDDGAKLGTQSLARATENPAIQELLKQSSTKMEKAIKAIPGEGNVFKEKILENVGLRSKNLKTDRGDAIRSANHKVDNNLDEVVEQLTKDVKDGAIGKESLQEVKSFIKSLKTARSAGKAGNAKKYERHMAQAEKELSSIGKGDDYLASILKDQLNSVKTSNKLVSSATDSKENPFIAELATIGLGGTAFFSDGGILGGLGAMGAAKGARHVANKAFTKSVNKKSKQVDKALKGELGALKSRHKQMKKLTESNSGLLTKAYLAGLDSDSKDELSGYLSSLFK